MIRSAIFLAILFAFAACGSPVDQKGTKKQTNSDTNNGVSNNGGSNNGVSNNGNNTGSCGDGALNPGELCDPGIAAGAPGACPTGCQAPACSTATLEGSADACTAQCIVEPLACADGDGCCPSGCDASNDSECTNTCGDGVIDSPETCDGDCPSSCNDGDVCTIDTLVGAAASCNAQCRFETVTTCAGGDGCCPSGCTNSNDSDCQPAQLCGNGVIDGGETCDGDCPTSCNDGDACTTDALVGSAAACTAECTFQTKTACQSGDGCCPSGCTSANDNDCACVPRTCAQVGAQCGSISDGCGRTIQCNNTCSAGESCSQNSCIAPNSYIGQTCTDYPQCGSTPEAACLLAPSWPNGYCSLLCNTTSCPSGSHCVQFDGQDKLCMLDCTSNSNCRSGYECRNWDAAGAKECVPPPRTSGGVGDACTSDLDCPEDYFCETTTTDSNGNTTAVFPGGACTASCLPFLMPCPTADGVCTDLGYCMNECLSNADCRAGYSCTFSQFSNSYACAPN